MLLAEDLLLLVTDDARAAEIAQGNWASAAVRKAIDEMIAAGGGGAPPPPPPPPPASSG